MRPEAKMPEETAGKGASADAPRLWLRAVREGWNIPEVVKKAAVSRAAQILADPSSTRREVARATQTIAILERLALDAAVHEDRMRRLDDGTATENLTLVDLPDTTLAAVARSIVNPDPAKPGRKHKRKA
jgi:hypothetical protein